jgi:predicted O-methyltransferase YrrM
MSYPYPTRTPRIPLDAACERIAAFFDLDGQQIHNYALQDDIGGYHHDPDQRRLNDKGELAKGIWGVEGQVIYALIRYTQPRHVLEVGNCWGTSSVHIGEAVLQNGSGKVTTLDLPVEERKRSRFKVPQRYQEIMTPVYEDLRDFNYRKRPRLDFVFEDSSHTAELVSHVWREFLKWGAPGGFIVSHDSEHFRVGEGVHEGIQQVVEAGAYLSLAIAPADCGLAIWRKP